MVVFLNRLTFPEFLEGYRTKEIYLVNDVPEFLRKDVIIPQPLQCEQSTETLDQTVMPFRIIVSMLDNNDNMSSKSFKNILSSIEFKFKLKR